MHVEPHTAWRMRQVVDSRLGKLLIWIVWAVLSAPLGGVSLLGLVYGFYVINSAPLFSNNSWNGFETMLMGAGGMTGIASAAIRLAYDFQLLKDKSILRSVVIGGVVLGIAVACYPIVRTFEFRTFVVFLGPILFGLVMLVSTLEVGWAKRSVPTHM